MLFVPHLKRRGHLDNLHFTLCLIGSRQIVPDDDWGTSGWSILAPNLTIYGFDADAKACAIANQNFARSPKNWTEIHVPIALWDNEGIQTLHLTEPPGCSSLFPLETLQVERFLEYLFDGPFPRETIQVETTTLDRFCQMQGIKSIDFLHLDVQGGELNVLDGARKMFQTGILGVMTEVNFLPLYRQQPLFGDIDRFLNQQGFSLFNFNLPEGGKVNWQNSTCLEELRTQRLVWSDAYYFQDLLAPTRQSSAPPQQLMKLACLADMLGFMDYALEVLLFLTQNYASDPAYNTANVILESLIDLPHLAKRGITQLAAIRSIIDYADSEVITSVEQASKSLESIVLPLQLREFNILLIPDWSIDEEILGLKFVEIFNRLLSYHRVCNQISLVFYADNIEREQAEMILSYVSLIVMENINIPIEQALDYTIVGDVTEEQWQEIITHLNAYIKFQYGDRSKIERLGISHLHEISL
ncbi:MAG: FkbM family methyltransferase [Cyanobacteria bacterium P01_E01_bin.42]